ncbi:sterol O-acyltransferase 1 [Nephila pilipes]|uniref:O-acyltransferase n=1 Tax=Nephila pilipes TaxID=299642 RepID=A0A8X6TK73_NEPPI|nr:sterol O-acyltransferase 1 [Nephila pilipes]
MCSTTALHRHFNGIHRKAHISREIKYLLKKKTMGHHAATEDSNKGSKEMNGNTNIMQEKQNDSKKTALPKKVYTQRNSVLTDLMEVNHLQTVYNISVAICVLLFINLVMYYIATPEVFWRDIGIVGWAASNVQLIVKMLISFHIFAFLILYGFKTWTRVRNKINTKLADLLFLLIYIAIAVSLFVATSYILVQNVFRPISNFIIMCEQVRIFLKTYSFVRESAPRVLKYKPMKDGKQDHNLYPTVKHYSYYLFVPATIYRDSYPRKKEINYGFVVAQIFKFFACIFISYCTCVRFMVDIFQDVGTTPFTLKEAALTLAGSMVIGSLSMFLIFYGFLHSWLNICAELLRFADREFYQDWWNSTSFSQYYRKWNTVIYDWLYTYVYIEANKIGISRSLSLVLVFFISSAIHEYIIAMSLGFFYPVLGVMYLTVGVSLMFVTKNRKSQFWNTFMWSMLFSGWGFVISLYCLEWHARSNCERLDNPIQDFFVPRSWSKSCHIITFS